MRKSYLETEMAMEFVVGAFVFMILLALGVFTIILSRENIFRKQYPLEVHFADVGSLREGDNVVVRGVPVGKIKKLVLDGQGVKVIAGLDRQIRIKKDYRISIVASSILGGRYMVVYEGADNAALLQDSKELQGIQPVDLVEEASAMVHEIRGALEQQHIMDNLGAAVADLKDAAAKINRGEGTIAKLLSDDSVYKDIQSLSSDLKTTAAGLREIVEKVDRGEGTVGKLINDETLYQDVQKIAANLKDLSDRLAQGKGTMGKLLSEDDQLYQDLSSTVSSLKTIAGRVERGEGTLGKLLTDESLYRDVQKTVGEVHAAVDDFRETTPVVSFAQLLFGAL